MEDAKPQPTLSPEDEERILKTNRHHKGTWALLIAIAVVFSIARMIMKASAS